VGRQSKLNAERQARLCEALRAGNTRAAAADYAGVGKTTFYRWIDKGKEQKTGAFRDFWDAVKKAEADAEVRNVAIIQQAAKKTWQAAAWLLERRRPSRWALRQPQRNKKEDIVVDLVKVED